VEQVAPRGRVFDLFENQVEIQRGETQRQRRRRATTEWEGFLLFVNRVERRPRESADRRATRAVEQWQEMSRQRRARYHAQVRQEKTNRRRKDRA